MSSAGATSSGNSVYACDIGVGNCTDYHSYFMSLSRTLNIPSRFHMGFNVPNKKEGKIGGYHCWSDYYVEHSFLPGIILPVDSSIIGNWTIEIEFEDEIYE